MVVDKTEDAGLAQIQSDVYTATARYVRVTVTGLPPRTEASFYEFRVFDSPPVAPPALPARQALPVWVVVVGVVSLVLVVVVGIVWRRKFGSKRATAATD